ncbi:hypothetical protein [Empedobacter tilapiae]|uniref:Nucleotidyltransferase n=1 Tax=Empedobacter tilapiae TaxID=2491114 RepID=A0A4Z1B6L9_9FLAO|nr:hypothetical protein [Empedobacter tilapiae]TGN26756.1 hypothetical protein E4J94_09935 [Empedobacter tilapiae]
MSVESYKNEMIAAKENNSSLRGLTSNSKTSIWGQMFYVMAYSLDLLAQLFTTHRKEIDEKIKTQKTHRLEWIRQLYLNFQYGKAIGKDIYLKPETDIYDNTGLTEDQVERSKIIKYCAVSESNSQKEVLIKIATEDEDKELSPITDQDVIKAVEAYTKEVKGVGIPYRIINSLPDLLQLIITIYRDPLVLDSQGGFEGEYPVNEALKEFMRELPFDGELRLQDLSNKLEKIDGVKLVDIEAANSSWIDASTRSYGGLINFKVRKTPASGYFKITFDKSEESIDYKSIIKYAV